MKLILVILLAGSIFWDVAEAHRRHPPRLQRMAARPHPRPPRHHPAHPNMIPVGSHVSSHRPHRSYKPRLHIPLLHGLHRHPLRGHHPHHHHHRHPPSHHHNGPHHHPQHHHSPHHHHHQRQPGPQQAGAQQQLRLPQNQVVNAFAQPSGIQQQGGFGFPMDTTPAHSSQPSAAPAVKQPVHQFSSHPPPPPPPPYFQQDDIPFNEQISEHPNLGGFPTQASLPKLPPQHATQGFGPSALGDNSPHGYLSSTYKGWKPISKPFQSSYPRNPEIMMGPQHGPQDFQRGPQDFQRGQQDFQRGQQEFQRGPPIQEFSDNHLPAFPQNLDGHSLPDFPNGPLQGPQHQNSHHQEQFLTGPPQQGNQNNVQPTQDYSQGPPENLMEGFPHIPDPPQIPNFPRAPAAPVDNQLLEFPQQDQENHNMHQFPGPPQHHHQVPHRHHHQHQQQRHPQRHHHHHHHPGKVLFQQPGLNNDFGPPSSTPKDDFQFLTPGGGPQSPDAFNNLNTNTLFRENILHMKSHAKPGNLHHNQDNAPNSNDVEIHLPAEIGDSVRLPNSLFTDNSWNQNSRQPFETSQSEENIVVKKPKYSPKLKLGPNGPVPTTSSDEDGVEPPPSVFPKFKPGRPRFHKTQQEKSTSNSLQDQEPENDGPPKVSQGSDEVQPPISLKNKLNGGRGRVRIRTRLRRPNPFNTNSGEDGGSGDSPGSGSKIFPPFPGSKQDSPPRRPIFRKQQHSPPSDNNLSTESRDRPGDNSGSPGLNSQGGENEIKNLSEEVGQLGPLPPFPSIPFPPSEAEIFREFPGAGPSKEPELVRESQRLPPVRPPLGGRGSSSSSTGSTEQSSVAGQFIRQRQPENNSSPPPRAHIGVRRRRPKNQQQQQQQQQSQQSHKQHDIEDKEQSGKDTSDNPETTPPVVLNENPAFSDEFFFPPGFNQDPSKQQENPVSFITMPNARTQVIHHNHNYQQSQSLEQNGIQQQPLAQQPSQQPPQHHSPNHNFGNNFKPQQDFPLEQGRAPNFPLNSNPPFARHPGQHPPGNHQLSSYSDHLPFSRGPSRGRLPKQRSHPPTKSPPPGALNPYSFPNSNPYAAPPVSGPPEHRQHLAPFLQQAGPRIPLGNHNELNYDTVDNAPQTSNSYEVPETAFGTRQSTGGHHPNGPPHHHTAPPQPLNILASPHPPQRHLPSPTPTLLLPAQGLGRGRHPGRGGHRQRPVAPVEPPMGQSAEFEQIPAQYVEHLPLNPDVTFPTSSVAPIPAIPQARPVYTKPHVHHSPDIHPPGSYFDDFFKPFDDAFVQKQGASPPRPDDPNGMQDEQQSQSNVRLNVVPSPKNMTGDSDTSSKKHWSKLKPKDEKVVADSSEGGKHRGKKPIGRFSTNSKNHLKAKIADITRKNFQTHIMSSDPDKDEDAQGTKPTQAVNSSAPEEVAKPKETTLRVIPTFQSEDDLVDSNIPKSIRFSSKTESGPILIRGKQDPHDPNQHDGTTILFKSKRQFRRKRPGPKKPFTITSEELVAATEGRQETLSPSERPQEEPNANANNGDDEPSETVRVGVLRRRKLFPRRRNFSLSKGKDGKDGTTTPEATDQQPVTFGEDQWFRVKKFDSEERNSEAGKHAEGDRTHLNGGHLATPVPTPESKTAPEGDSSSPPLALHGGEATSKSKKTLSDHPPSPQENRPFGKKSSKFLMNRLPLQ